MHIEIRGYLWTKDNAPYVRGVTPIILETFYPIPNSYDNVKFELDFSIPDVGPMSMVIAEKHLGDYVLVRVTGETDRMPDTYSEDTGKLSVHSLVVEDHEKLVKP